MPNSETAPAITTAIMVTINAYSTAVAPCSVRSTWVWDLCMVTSLNGWRWVNVLKGAGDIAATGPLLVAGSESAGDLLEQAVEAGAEGTNGDDDRDRDQRDHQAVLDGGGALLLVATDEHEGDELLEHDVSP